MGYTLEQFAKEVRDALKAEPGPNGRKKVVDIVQSVLKDDAFVAKHVGDDVPERKILYEDPELGFCILAHNYHGREGDRTRTTTRTRGRSTARRRARPQMSDWDKVEPATPDKPGKVKHRRVYTLTPGMAHVYNEGDLHSPRREGSTKLIRIEGTNMEKVKRLSYEKA